MHGHSQCSALLVNAEVNSMGGVVDGGVGLDAITSPRHAAIEKAQAELRLEFDVREERRRELEFLENGGNPLDFKVGHARSISVQSTSLTDQLGEQYVLSEAKGSFALTASPHGDSVDSSGRPGAPLGRESNYADNLLLFGGEAEMHKQERNGVQPSRRATVASSEQSSQLDGSTIVRDSEVSAVFCLGVKRQAYARRNRTRPSRESGHACSTVPSAHGNGSTVLPSSQHDKRDSKGLLCEDQVCKDHGASSICNSKTTSPNGEVGSKTFASESQLDAVHVHEVATSLTKVREPDGSYTGEKEHNQHNLVVGSSRLVSASHDSNREKEERVSVGLDSAASTEKPETCAVKINGLHIAKGDQNNLQIEDHVNRFGVHSTVPAGLYRRGLDSESSCSQFGHSLDADIDSEQCLLLRKVDTSSNECSKELSLVFKETPHIPETNDVEEYDRSTDADVQVFASDDLELVARDVNNHVKFKIKEEICDNRTNLQSTENPIAHVESMKHDKHLPSDLEAKLDNPSDDHSNFIKMDVCSQVPITNSNYEPWEDTFDERGSKGAPELQNCEENHLNMASKMHEDVILEKAQIIEANCKRVGEQSISNCLWERHRKSHWDFVLEEMAWLANDFMQERLWKTTAAAQISHWVAFVGCLKFDEANQCQKRRNVARTLAKTIMEFWSSAERHLNSDEHCEHLHEYCKSALFDSQKETEVYPDKRKYPIQGYAMRFLKCNNSSNGCVQAEAPMTPDRTSDAGILDISWEDQPSEESFFYTVRPGAMQEYRESVESHWAEYEVFYELITKNLDKKMNSMIQEEHMFLFDSGSEFGARENTYEEDGVVAGMHYLPGAFEGSKSSEFGQSRRKNLQKLCTARSYDITANLPYSLCLENKLGNQTSTLIGKRPCSNLNVGLIPTKRARTSARQRVGSPFGTGVAGGLQVTSKADGSSDTSSFQDEQSSLQGGSQLKKSLEVESTGDFGKHLPSDGTEISTKPKKKKKAKILGCRKSLNSTDSGAYINSGKGSTLEQRWQMDSIVQHEQNHPKRRYEDHHVGSIGNTGSHSQKKSKLLKQLPDASPEISTPHTGSIPSPVASQMSNMSNPNKLINMFANRDGGRKGKVLKIHAGKSGAGVPWSMFEDQALVVLVHDMGPNWELISDAINSTLHFKCILRKSNECKERHKFLMDRNSADGAESAEDSGIAQAYPTNLPGIPKGSARQLFQRLQGPMEEDIVKAHFEKIILIGQQLHSCKSQNDNLERKQIPLVHNSHVLALSQACPYNLSGGPLTPLDLCDATTSNSDVISLGYQGSPAGGLAVRNHQGPLAPISPTSGSNYMIPGSSGMVISNCLQPTSSALSAPARDVQRHGAPRPSSLPTDEQQRVKNHILAGRNVRSSSLSVSGALPVGTDCGVHMPPGAAGMGVMCGMNRGVAVPRPGFQGIGSPAMLNMGSSGNMLSPSGIRMPSPPNIHTGAVSGQGKSMLRTHDALTMLRPGQNADDQRHLIMQEFQLQVAQGNAQGAVPFNGLTSVFSSPLVQTLPVQQQRQHQMSPQSHVLNSSHHSHLQGTNHSPQEQAYAHRQQIQLLHQQQRKHQFTTLNASMPHAHSQAQQHAVSSPQSSSQIQQQKSSQPVSVPSPNTQHPLTPLSSPINHISMHGPQKQHHGPLGLSRNPQASAGLANQMLNQRQRQQLQQQPRQQAQQRQQSQSQQAKVMKGIGRGGMLMHHNLPLGTSHVNGVSTTPGNQAAEKEDQSLHLMQGHRLFSGSNPVQGGKQLVPQPSNHCQQQHKIFSPPLHPASQQLAQIPTHLEHSNQGQVPPNSTLLGSQQPVPSSPLSRASQQRQQLQRQQSQSQQTVQRMLQQNCPTSSDDHIQSSNQVPVNPNSANGAFQLTASSTALQCTDLVNIVPAVSSVDTPPSQWKADPLYETNTAAPSTQLCTIGHSPQPNSNEAESMSSCSQELAQEQFSGSIPIHGHAIGGQWQQLPPSEQQQELQQQQQHRQAGQSNLHARPSDSGSGGSTY